ncbi:polysaccharide deacetylase family protein [Actinoplanes rectilineatus]|uniref:polysaccharide deacetylase family protein n=1 Tax=Actinoplanes rectilineatus TaxID=113571 RepID=UPI000696AE59|nr:polysaccharide deacetylase family protein [Actinoplanes rectilineatus]
MNTDKPTPAAESGTSGTDEPAEPTVLLPAAPTAGSEPTVDLSAASSSEAGSEAGESEPTVNLTASAEPEPPAAPSAEKVPEQPAAPSEEEVPEPTVVLPSPRPAPDSEPTVALTPRPEAEAEPTVAMAVPAEAEPTVAMAIPAEVEAEPTVAMAIPAKVEAEPTVAMPIPPSVEAEPTVAMAIPPKVEAEPTVALPKPRPAPPVESDEPTVAMPAPPKPERLFTVPKQRSVTTVAPPPAEPTIALPAPPKTPVPVPPQAKPLTRRRLLWAIPAVAGTALVGGTIAALAGRDEPRASAPNLTVSEPPPPPSQSPTPVPTTPRPTTPVMKVPVHTLADFRRMVPGDPFPTDAIALTIDDGPHPEWTPPILRLLEKHGVPALFCMIGNQVLGHESTARDVVNDGHHVANHTWSHPLNVAELSSRKAIKELHRAQDKIYSTTDFAPSLFRAPGGAWSDGLSKSVSQAGMIPMDWTTDPRDWSRPGVGKIVKRLLASEPGQILLCHDGGGDRSQTLAALKTVIPALQAKGLKFVALA